jgi:hypothetical protein
MIQMIRFLVAILFLALAPGAFAAATLEECQQACIKAFPVIPPTTGATVFPDQITFERSSDQGAGVYYGTAVILFPTSWEGRITSVIVNGEAAFHGTSYKGRPVFRLLKTGDQYARPLKFTIAAADGTIYTATSGTSSPVNPPSSSPQVAGNGILWKPVADSGGDLVVLLDRSYGKPTVRVLSTSGAVIEAGRFVYYSNPNRATYRFDRPGRDFPKPCLLQVGNKTFTVLDGAKRYE